MSPPTDNQSTADGIALSASGEDCSEPVPSLDSDQELLRRLHEFVATVDPSALVNTLYATLLGVAGGNAQPKPSIVAGQRAEPHLSTCEQLLQELAARLPKTQQDCLAEVKKHGLNDRSKIMLLRAALLQVKGDARWLHYELLFIFNRLALGRIPGATAACLLHAPLALAGGSLELLPRTILARELASIAPRDALVHALRAVELGGGSAVATCIADIAQYSPEVPTGTGPLNWSFLKAIAHVYSIPFLQGVRIANTHSASRICQFEVVPQKVKSLPPPEGDNQYYLFRAAGHDFPVPPITIYALEGGTVSFDVRWPGRTEFYIFDADGNCLDDLSCGGAPFIAEEPLQVSGELGVLSDRFAGPMSVCHFLLDQFTRVPLYRKVAADARLLCADDYPYYRDVTRLAGMESEFLWRPAARFSVRADRLLVSDSIGSALRHPAHLGASWAIDFVRQSLIKGNRAGERRLFISRDDAGSRLILNWPEIAPILRAWGYEIVRLSDLSVVQQIELFTSAAYVVGVHGAGLTNVIFSPPGLKVLEILPPLAATMAYWILCIAMGHRYHALIADDPEMARPDYTTWQHRPELNSRNIVVPPAKLQTALAELHSGKTPESTAFVPDWPHETALSIS